MGPSRSQLRSQEAQEQLCLGKLLCGRVWRRRHGRRLCRSALLLGGHGMQAAELCLGYVQVRKFKGPTTRTSFKAAAMAAASPPGCRRSLQAAGSPAVPRCWAAWCPLPQGDGVCSLAPVMGAGRTNPSVPAQQTLPKSLCASTAPIRCCWAGVRRGTISVPPLLAHCNNKLSGWRGAATPVSSENNVCCRERATQARRCFARGGQVIPVQRIHHRSGRRVCASASPVTGFQSLGDVKECSKNVTDLVGSACGGGQCGPAASFLFGTWRASGHQGTAPTSGLLLLPVAFNYTQSQLFFFIQPAKHP